MNRYRVMDAVDSLLGTSSLRGDLVRVNRSGVHTNRDDLWLPDRIHDIDPCTPHRHGKLSGLQRCFGCGRTKNEIELEEGS
jgi:hypothetical protein